MTATQGDKAYLTATSSSDLSKATDVKVQWYYSADPTKDATGKLVSSSSGDLKLQLDTSAVGSGSYKCVISCKLDGKTAVVSYSASEWIKVVVTEVPSAPLALSAVGKQSIDITEAYQTVDFEVTPSNANGEVRYKWYYCDASGNVTDETPIGDGQAVIIHGVTGKTGEKFYYKCIATDSKNTASLVFSCTIKYQTGDTNVPDTDTGTPDTNVPDAGTDTADTSIGTDSSDDTMADTSSTDNPANTDNADTDEPLDQKESGAKPWLIIVIFLVLAAGVIVVTVAVVTVRKKKKSN